MNYQLVSSYKDTPKLPREVGALTNTPHFSFIDGPKVEITGQADESYEVNFIDRDTGAVVYTSNIKNNMWCASSLKYYVDWKLEVKRHGVVVAEEVLNLKDKKVKVVLDTNSIGDIFAYVGAVDAFQVKHGCKMHCVIYPREVREIFAKSYSNIVFEPANDDDSKYYAVYTIGWFNDWEGRSHQNPRQISLANLAGSILGLGELEFKPKLPSKSFKEGSGKKYVCIAIQSTAQFKYWNNPTGWSDVVEYLKDLGYEVWCIDRHSSFGIPGHMNKIPKGVIDKTGDFSLQKRLEQLRGADFFIGLSSGLSWMAWAVNKPVILISGMGQPWTEFFTPHRVINTSVCHGCTTEDSFVFEKDNWLLCPHKKNFECTRQISSKMVIDEINRVRSGEFEGMEQFDWGWYSSTKNRWPIFNELFRERTYERFFKVEEGDVVMDIGAHLGAFSYSVRKSGVKRIIAVEPSATRCPALEKNLAGLPVTIIKKGIGDKTESIRDGLVFDGVVEDLELVPFDEIIKQQKLEKIDFLKIDCEGGEYSIFNEQNIDWIKSNVKKIAGEWHLETLETKRKFKAFCTTYLKEFPNHRVMSINGVDIKTHLIDIEKFAAYYNEVMIYIDNRDTAASPPVVIETGLRALVTGASGGLGSALEAECASRNLTYVGHGCHSPRPSHIVCDFSDLDAVMKMEDVIKKNNINCLINNAGIYTNQNFPDLSDKAIIELLHINLVAPTLLAKYLYKHLTSTNQPGYIVNIISLAGKYPNYNEAVYCASKYGLSGLGSSLSINQKNSKIRVIDLHLGAIKTRLTKHRPNYNDLIEPAEVAKLVLDMIQNKGQYVASSMEIRNIK